jgi:hypothetical protein
MERPNRKAPSEEAIAWMKEIFNDPSRSKYARKFPTPEEVRKLREVYDLDYQQVTKEFRKMSQAEWIMKKRKASKEAQVSDPSKTSVAMQEGLGYPFEHCSVKRTNIDNASSEKTTRVTTRRATKCDCVARSRQCVQSYEHFFEAGRVTCKNARWADNIDAQPVDSIRIRVKECTRNNCASLRDCGNRYTCAEHHLSKCVVAEQFRVAGGSIRGLKVMKGAFIPAWSVIGEYTGKVVRRGRQNQDSEYVAEIDDSTYIDAEREGNCTRFINHRCKDFNAVLIPVRAYSTDTVFVRSVKAIKENEFVTINYGENYKLFFKRCLCESCCHKRTSSTLEGLPL